MPEQTDAELVARGMAVVRPMIEDRRWFDAWLRQAALEAQGQGDYGEPSAWQGWRAGKADLAQQVWDALDAAFAGTLPNGDPSLHGQQIADLLDLLAEYGAGAQL